MNHREPFTCRTDYPFVELGDAPNQIAPERQVTVLSYDGDKYAKIRVLGSAVTSEIKIGYLYSASGRYGQAQVVEQRELEEML